MGHANTILGDPWQIVRTICPWVSENGKHRHQFHDGYRQYQSRREHADHHTVPTDITKNCQIIRVKNTFIEVFIYRNFMREAPTKEGRLDVKKNKRCWSGK